ncbi:MAG: hypothetical protein MR850_07075 [Bacteroidales bacterium]|nr:hypothetical protein [Bacteroidales bacterium]
MNNLQNPHFRSASFVFSPAGDFVSVFASRRRMVLVTQIPQIGQILLVVLFRAEGDFCITQIPQICQILLVVLFPSEGVFLFTQIPQI